MTYAIFDTGNLVASFDEEDAAHEALDRIAREDEGPRLVSSPSMTAVEQWTTAFLASA